MALLRYKTTELFSGGRELSPLRRQNTERNRAEAARGESRPASFPRRLVLELTNDCNLQCRMCGRFDADFKKVYFNCDWLKNLEPIFPALEEVTLMGWGEPTIHPDFSRLLRFFHQQGIRIYFCTNGMTLHRLKDEVFANQVDVIAISLDGSSPAKNAAIRQGSDFESIVAGIREITAEKHRRGVGYPYMNSVTTLMADNLDDFPAIVKLAADLGLEEAKAVYLTAFSPRQREQILAGRPDEVRKIFDQALALGKDLGVDVKLPQIEGSDPAGRASHQTCHVAWRDFFIGSDGYVRPCMSTPQKFFHVEECQEFLSLWHHRTIVDFRERVNCEEKMDCGCRFCYQSSHANWNRPEAFDRSGTVFAPEWRDEHA